MPALVRAALLGLCLWLLAAGATASVGPVDLDALTGVRDLEPHLELLEDPGGEWDIATVQASPDFQPAPADGVKIGFSRSAWWVRVTLVNTAQDDVALVLRENYPLIDEIELWASQPDGAWRVTRTGDRLPFSSRGIAHRDFLFALDVPASSQQTVYLRFASTGPIDIALELYEPRALVEAISLEQLAYGAYFGSFIVLVLYNLFIFLVVRDKAFFWYLLYAVSYGLYFSVFNGLSFQLLWPDQPAWANTSLLLLLACTLVFGMQFTRMFLDSATMAPRLDRFALGLQALALLALALSFVLPYSLLIQPLALLTVAITATIMALGTLGLVKGYKPARYFMLAWGLLLVGVLANMLKTFGLLPHNMLTQNGFQVGSLCEMVLLSLALASRVSEMQQQSRTDALTRLFNRRHFDERVAAEFERAQRLQAPIALLVIDIDHFKPFNDRHGHARGDEVLRMVAERLREGVRDQDIACRYGGEEFAVILPNTDGEQAAVAAEKLRATIAAGAPVTISIGVASPDDGGIGDVGELFRAADAALYEAKAQGRNRVVRFRPLAAAFQAR